MGSVAQTVARAAAHRVAGAVCRARARRFSAGLKDVEATQRAVLARQLRRIEGTEAARRHGLSQGDPAEVFRRCVPESSWEDVATRVERQRAGEPRVLTRERCERYQPTSGSSSAVKWVPYPRGFLSDLDEAITPWLADLYARVPKVAHGQHYWSLSWVPSALRGAGPDNLNDDSQLVSWDKRLAAALMAPVPPAVAYTATSEDSLFATACFVAAARDLTFVSVWSPTFALGLLEVLKNDRDEIVTTLRTGAWQRGGMTTSAPRSPRAASILASASSSTARDTAGHDVEVLRALWPQLALVSAWDTSSSARWARELQAALPWATFQGKGLWATEGVVTIPYGGAHVLSARSHFYEFVDLADGKVYFPWELRVGQEVRPLLTTGAGLLRYGLRDRLIVRSHLFDTPCFEFLGRIGDRDLVGEKMSAAMAQSALSRLDAGGQCCPVSLLPVDPEPGEKPHYLALCEGPADAGSDTARAAVADAALREYFHYELARDLGQLGGCRVVTHPNARTIYEDLGASRGMVRGNIKIEPLGAIVPQAVAAALMGEPQTMQTRPRSHS